MTRTPFIALSLVAALALTACNNKPAADESKAGAEANANHKATTSVTIDGNATANSSAININSDDFDIDGVGLYPGSSIKAMNVDAVDTKGNKQSTVKVGFESPADAKTVADWFEAEMKKEKFTVTRSGYDLSGTTDDGDAFTLKIADLGGGKASGNAVITDKD